MYPMMKYYNELYSTFIKLFKSQIFFVSLLSLGLIFRLLDFGDIPEGLHQDEVSIGYETYSLLKTGKDRWGLDYPVYFISWGSGQNTLYAYLSLIPVQLFGLNDFSIRLVSGILGLLTVWLVYQLVYQLYHNKNLARICTIIYMFDPWHFIQSRWALEPNILPFFLILFLVTFTSAINAAQESKFSLKNKIKIIFCLTPLAILLYCYAISIFIIPFFIIISVYYFRRELYLKPEYFLYSFGIFLALSLPFALFILKNNILKTDLGIEAFLPFSVPKMFSARESIPGNLEVLFHVIVSNIKFVISGFDDETTTNMTNTSGSHFMIVFSLLGLYFTATSKKRADKILAIWFISCFSIFFLFSLNLTRSNCLQTLIPVMSGIGLYFTIKSLSDLRLRLFMSAAFSLILCVQTTLFFGDYFIKYPKYSVGYLAGYKEALQEAVLHKRTGEKIAITKNIVFNYLYTAFYQKFDPFQFQHSNWKANVIVDVYSFGDFIMLGNIAGGDVAFNYDYKENVNYLLNQKSFLCVLKNTEEAMDRKHEIVFVNDVWKVLRYL